MSKWGRNESWGDGLSALRGLFLGISLSLLTLSSGCTLGSFFGGGKDEGVSGTPNYRPINTACAQMKLSSSLLDVPTLRSLVHCLNSYGALEPIEQLVQGLNDRELQPLVDANNQYVLGNKKRLFEIQETYFTLKKQGLVDESFQHFGKLLENRALTSSTLALFKDGFLHSFKEGSDPAQPSAGSDLLKAMETFSGQLTENNWANLLDLGILMSEAPAFHSLQTHFKGKSPKKRSLDDVTAPLLAYLREDHTYLCDNDYEVPIKQDIMRWLAEGDQKIFDLFQDILGTTPKGIKKNVPELAALLRETLRKDVPIRKTNDPVETSLMRQLAWSFQDFNGPIECIQRTKSIPNAASYVTGELARLRSPADSVELVLEKMPKNLMVLGPFCNYPNAMTERYVPLSTLARRRVAGPDDQVRSVIELMTELIQKLYGVEKPWRGCSGNARMDGTYHPLAGFFIQFLADAGKNPKTGERGTGGFEHLIPLLAELSDRDAWTDLLLTASVPLPAGKSQRLLQNFIQTVMSPVAPDRSQSIFDLLVQLTSESKLRHINSFILGLKEFVDSPDPVFGPAARVMRDSYYANDVHPFLGILHDAMAGASQNKDLFLTVFKVSDSKAFQSSIALLSTMAKDGRLRDLVETMVSLYRKFAEQGKRPIKETVVPQFTQKPRHTFSQDDLISLEPAEKIREDRNCSGLDFSFSLGNIANADVFSRQVDRFLACSKNDELRGLLRFLKDSRIGHEDPRQNTDFLRYSIGLTKNLLTNPGGGGPLSHFHSKYLVDQWLSAYADGRFYRLLDAIPLWVNGLNAHDVEASSVLKPLLEVGAKVMTSPARADFQILETYAGNQIQKNDFPKLLRSVDDLTQPEHEPEPIVDQVQYDFEGLKEEVKWRECYRPEFNVPNEGERNRNIEARALEIIHEFKFNATNWDLVAQPHDAALAPRQSWSLNELKYGVKDLEGGISPILDKMAVREESRPDYTPVQASLNFLNYYTLPENALPDQRRHFTPEYLKEWFRKRAQDVRTILFFYPGKREPVLRMVNTLDLLEIVLIMTDFKMPLLGTNMAYDFLTDLALAEGDRVPAFWSTEVRNHFSQRNPPKTLRAAAKNIIDRPSKLGIDNLTTLTYSYLGVPKLPDCYRNNSEAFQTYKRVREKGTERDAREEDEKDDEYRYRDIQANPKFGHIFRPILNKLTKAEAEYYPARVYNIWQVRSVLLENSPGSRHPNAGGLHLLQRLFYELYASTPEKFRKFNVGEKNNLSIVTRAVRLGAFRQFGRRFLGFQENDETLRDFVKAITHGVLTPNMEKVMGTLLRSDPTHQLFWTVLEQVFRFIDGAGAGAPPATPEEVARVRQLGYYFLANLNHLEPWQPSAREVEQGDLVDLTLGSANAVLEGYRPLLLSHGDLIQDVFRSTKVFSFSKALYEERDPEKIARLRVYLRDVLTYSTGQENHRLAAAAMNVLGVVQEDPVAKAAWTQFEARKKELLVSRAYQDLRIAEAIRPILNFFEHRRPQEDRGSLQERREIELSNRIRAHVGRLLERNELDPFFDLVGRNPDDFYRVLRDLSQILEKGDHKEFFDLVNRSLSDPHR